MRWYVEFQVAGDAAQHHELTGLERANCGTSSAAHLRLPKLEGLPESVLHIEAKAEGVLLRRSSGGPPDIEFGNRTHRELCVPWEQDVFVDQIRFCFLQSKGADPNRSSGATGLLVLLLLAFAGLGVWGLQKGADGPVPRGGGPNAPTLWSDVDARCSVPQGAGYLERVLELQNVAEGKMARYPFDRRLGTEAVRLLEQASDCYAMAKAPSPQSQELRLALQRQASRLKLRVEQDYVSLRLSLEFARLKRDPAQERRLTQKLESLLALPSTHPYVRWLSGINRDASDRLRVASVAE